jgi:hypothetical protein
MDESMGGGQQHAQIQFTDDFPDSFQNSSAGGAQNRFIYSFKKNETF